MLKIHLSKKITLTALLIASVATTQTMAQVWLPQPGTEYMNPGNTNTYRLNRTSIGEILPASGLPVGQVAPQNDYKLSVFGGAITQRQRGVYGNFNTSSQWIGLGQNPTLSRIYGLGMHRTDRYAFYNLDSVTRVLPTKDLVIGAGSTGTNYDPNQRILVKGFFGSLVNNSRVLISANPARGAVGVNDENPLSTFFVNATGATGSANFSTFRSMFIINRGTPNNIPLSTFSAMGQEGNSVLNLPVHGFRTQAGDSNATVPLIAANFSVNTTSQSAAGQQEAEVQWQDLNFNPGAAFPAGFTGTLQDRLAFYFRTGANNINLRRKVMTMLGGAHVGINVPFIPVSFAAGNFIAGSGFNNLIRLHVNGGSVLADNYFWISDSSHKTDVVDITNADALLSSLRPRQYTFLQKNAETGEVVNKIPQYGFIAQEVGRGRLATISAKFDDGKQGVDYVQVVPILVANAQKMVTTIATQQATIDNLTATANRQAAQLAAYDDWAARVSQTLGIPAPPRSTDVVAPLANAVAGETTSGNAAQPADERVVANGARLLQNVPNPANGYTEIFYEFNGVGNASISIVDQQGRVRKVFNNLPKGMNKVAVNGGELAPGSYVYSININGRVAASKQMVVVR
jgi:hypothetical protein